MEGTEYKVFENSFFYRTHLAWNNLPLSTREITVSSAFRPKVLEHLWGLALHDQINELQEQNSPTFSQPNFSDLDHFAPTP